MNTFEIFNKANRNFFLQEMLDFSSTLGVLVFKDWRKSNMICTDLLRKSEST